MKDIHRRINDIHRRINDIMMGDVFGIPHASSCANMATTSNTIDLSAMASLSLYLPKIRKVPRILEDPNLKKQVRFPKSKKWRIRKKWAKRPENWGPDTEIYMTEDFIICHPSIAKNLRIELEG